MKQQEKDKTDVIGADFYIGTIFGVCIMMKHVN